MIKKTYRVQGMDCASCATLIEMDLEDAGIKAKCSYAKEILEVEFEKSKIGEEQIKNIVSKSGYTIT